MEPPLQLEYCSRTDIGLRRANNQDAHAEGLANSGEQWRHRGHLFLVADGMGAHAAGELASRMAAEIVPHVYNKLKDVAVPEAIRQAICEANAQIHQKGEADPEFQGMGTTCSALLVVPQGAVVAHVGDSRVYRLREQTLEQLTFDHSLIWEMSAAGHTSSKQVPSGIPKNIITRSLGPNIDVEVDLEGPFPIYPGDVFLLCSDGLTGQVDDKEIGTLLHCLSSEEATSALIDLANLRGGPDNITAIVVKLPKNLPAEQSEGIQSGQTESGFSRHLATICWAGATVTLLLSVLFLFVWQYLLLAGLFAVATAGLGYAALNASQKPALADREIESQSLGSGPHTSCRCVADKEFANELAGLVRQVKEASNCHPPAVDAEKWEKIQERANKATEQQRYDDAVREWARALHLAVQALRCNQ